MSDEGIIDRIAAQVLLTEGSVHAADTEVQHPFTIPKFGDAFEIEVTLTEMDEHIRLFPCCQIDFAKEIHLLPDRRLDEEPELVDAEFPVGKESLGTAVEKSDAALTAEGNFSERRAHKSPIVHGCLARAGAIISGCSLGAARG